jgi:hypothetical protein
MALDPTKNFAICTVSAGYASGITSIVLATGDGAKLPDPAVSGAFNLVWWNSTDYPDPSNDPSVEIVRCTARSVDTLTIIRAQEGTSDVNHNTGGKTYKVILSLTKKMMDDISTHITGAADDHTQYALLAGRAGGQTIIGGTAVTDALKLKGTSGIGTLTSPAIQGLVGNNGATIAFTVLNNAKIGVGTIAPACLLDVNGSIRSIGQDNPTSGVGAEITWDGTYAHLRGYNRDTLAYVKAAIAGSTVYLSGTNSGTNQAIVFKPNLTESSVILGNENWGIKTLTPYTTVDINGTVRSISISNPTAGEGVEVAYTVGVGYVIAYDRTGVAYKPIKLRGLTVALGAGSNDHLQIDATGKVGIGMAPTYSLDVTGNFRCSTGFGCNGTNPQTAYASGGALAAYVTGAFGLDSDAHMSALHALVAGIRAALVANGIMS